MNRFRVPGGVAVCLIALAGCAAEQQRHADDEPDGAARNELRPMHPTTVTAPAVLGALATGDVDAQGDAVGVVCVTCHAMLTPAPKMPRQASDAAGPHAGLRFEHGDQPCANCHADGRVHELHLADGRVVAPAFAGLLCRQCHGQQARDYDHGAHGGMRGHWDRTRGERTRNDCVACHNAHTPAYPQFLPAPPPRDRQSTGAPPHG